MASPTPTTRSNLYKSVVTIGDSYTYNNSLGVIATEFYTSVLEGLLNAAGANCTAYNNGVSGNTTGQMLYRVSNTIQYGVPDLAVIYGGVNDLQYNSTVQASPAPTTTVFAVASGYGQYYKAGTWMTINGTSRQILSVATDTITLATALSGAPTAGQVTAIDTQTNLTKIGLYLQGQGCTRIVYGLMHYMNFSSGGDTHASPLAGYVTLRGLQSAASAAVSGSVTSNFWSYMDNLIQTGVVVQGSYSWHVLDSNTHLNSYGETILAQSLYATIAAQTGWIAGLT